MSQADLNNLFVQIYHATYSNIYYGHTIYRTHDIKAVCFILFLLSSIDQGDV